MEISSDVKHETGKRMSRSLAATPATHRTAAGLGGTLENGERPGPTPHPAATSGALGYQAKGSRLLNERPFRILNGLRTISTPAASHRMQTGSPKFCNVRARSRRRTFHPTRDGFACCTCFGTDDGPRCAGQHGRGARCPPLPPGRLAVTLLLLTVGRLPPRGHLSVSAAPWDALQAVSSCHRKRCTVQR